jgi:RecJ-like exonuclease
MKCEACKGTGYGANRKPCFECNGSGRKCDVCGEACDAGRDICNACEAEQADEGAE